MNKQKQEVILELIDEIINSAICDDQIIKKNDESINPASHSRTVELAITLKEYVNEQI